METDLVRIFHVARQATSVPGIELFIITATLVARPDICLQLETVNPYAASLCERAHVLERSIAVEHEKTKFGQTLRKAYFITTAAA